MITGFLNSRPKQSDQTTIMRSTTVLISICTLSLFSSICHLASAKVECYVCPKNELSNCAKSSTSASFSEPVNYELENCTFGCGKLVSWNPKLPTQQDYVGLRSTVRNLEYKYCVNSSGWTGCFKSESAITTSIECVCTDSRCNGAGRGTAKLCTLAAMMTIVWSVLAV